MDMIKYMKKFEGEHWTKKTFTKNNFPILEITEDEFEELVAVLDRCSNGSSCDSCTNRNKCVAVFDGIVNKAVIH